MNVVASTSTKSNTSKSSIFSVSIELFEVDAIANSLDTSVQETEISAMKSDINTEGERLKFNC